MSRKSIAVDLFLVGMGVATVLWVTYSERIFEYIVRVLRAM